MAPATIKQASSDHEQQREQQSMYSVSVDDPDREGMSVGTMHLRPGQEYVVRLAGFPPSLPLSLQLIGSQEMADSVTKIVEAKQVVLAIPPGQVETGADGAANILWRVPETAPTGRRSVSSWCSQIEWRALHHVI